MQEVTGDADGKEAKVNLIKMLSLYPRDLKRRGNKVGSNSRKLLLATVLKIECSHISLAT